MSKIANNKLNTRFGVRSDHIYICSDVKYIIGLLLKKKSVMSKTIERWSGLNLS